MNETSSCLGNKVNFNPPVKNVVLARFNAQRNRGAILFDVNTKLFLRVYVRKRWISAGGVQMSHVDFLF